MNAWLRRSATAGAVAWAVIAVVAPFGVMEKLFLLAPLVAMPLAFALLEPAPWMVSILQPFAAAAATASFFVPPGTIAAGLAAPWAILTGVAALEGLTRVRTYSLEEVVTTLSLLLLPVGGGWLVATRAGLAPMGFGEPIALLTAVHFHFTAFLAPALAVLAGRGTRGFDRTLFRASAFGILGGTPLLAVGFLVSPLLKLAGVFLLAAALGGVALSQLRALPRLKGRMSKLLLALSSAAVLAGMLIAALYEIGFFTGRGWLSIPQVARSHGPLNGLGFAVAGLMAWTLERR
ncbi:MAG TPA: YndJ family transporter [Planctomycetota bacterium]